MCTSLTDLTPIFDISWRRFNFLTGNLRPDAFGWARHRDLHPSESLVTSVRAVAGVGFGTALLSVLTACSSGGGPITPVSPSSTNLKRTAAAASSTIFSGPAPVSVVTWWKQHPAEAPAGLAKRKLLLNQRGVGPRRFNGPDMRKYTKVLMVITCTKKVAYVVRLQVLDGLSIASTSGETCGGPNLSTFESPSLTTKVRKTEVEVEIPDGTEYYVTIYGTPAR
jgi:hypothetical protein